MAKKQKRTYSLGCNNRDRIKALAGSTKRRNKIIFPDVRIIHLIFPFHFVMILSLLGPAANDEQYGEACYSRMVTKLHLRKEAD